MARLVSAGEAAAPAAFASNVVQVAVPAANPAGITRLSDLAGPGVKVAVCQAAVPCGVVAEKVFAKAGISVTPVSLEADVKAVLTKVSLGEVDAGVVYVTDVRAAGARVKGIEVPTEVQARTQYPIATLTRAPNRATAAAFRAYVLSAEGSQVLAEAGFESP
jgi:molybdate transport system substrate-binding protein